MTRTLLHGHSGCSAGQLDGAEDRLRLVHRLVVLVGGLGVGDRAAAGLDVDLAVLDDDGADVDRGVEVAVPGEVADRAAVGAALVRLELVDDLHRPHLRRARRACPAGSAERSTSIALDPVAQRARDLADDVEDVGVGLDDHQLVDLDRCRTRRPGRGRCGRGRPASRARRAPWGRRRSRSARRRSSSSSRRAGRCRRSAASRPGRPVHLDQRLRRGAGDLEVAEVEEVHVGRGVDRAQAAVDREGLDRGRRR